MLTSAILVAGVDPPAAFGDGPVRIGRESAACLIPVLDRPLLAHAVEELAAAGIEEVVVVADPPIAERVGDALDHDVCCSAEVSLIERDPALTLPAAIARARLAINYGPFVLRFADGLAGGELRSQLSVDHELDEHDAIALTSRFEGVGDPTSLVAGMPETSDFQVGAFALGDSFPIALAEAEVEAAANWMDAALTRMEVRGGHVHRRLVSGWWRRRGQAEPCLEANRFMLATMRESPMEAAVEASELHGVIRCHPSAVIESSVIRGPVAIGADVRISDAFVGPFSSIGRRATIDGAEIENSVVLEGCVVSDIGARLDSSVIGPHAKIARDFRIPRGTRLNLGPGASVSL